MQLAEFCDHVCEILERDPGSLTGDEALAGLENWDSLAVISYIVLVDENFHVTIDSEQLATAKTVGDLYKLAAEKAAA